MPRRDSRGKLPLTNHLNRMEENRDKGCVRSIKFDRAAIDVEKRTVPLAFSSEEPVERWGENEVLSHEKGDYDFSRINAGDHPLMLGHNEGNARDQIGVIESAKIGPDKVGRAVVRFSRSELGEEIFKDVQEGIRQLVSVGYDRTGIVKSDKDKKTNQVTTRYKWMPTHIAIVPVSADHPKTGIGRELNSTFDISANTKVSEIHSKLTPEQQRDMKNLLDGDGDITEKGNGNTKPAAGVVVDEGKIRGEERARIVEWRKAIRKESDDILKDRPDTAAKLRELETQAESEDWTPETFGYRAMREVAKIEKPKPLTMAGRGVNPKDAQRYSILRGIQSCIKHDCREPKEGLELEWHREVHADAMKSGCEVGGFLVPFDAPVRGGRGIYPVRDDGSPQMTRDLNVSTFGQGGALVPTELMGIIEIFRNKMVLARRGIIVLSGLTGNVAIPRQTAAATAYSLPEQGALTISTQAIDQITLYPHRVGVFNQYARQLLIQSHTDVEGFVRDDLMKVLALKWDYLGLFGGGGASEPTGIVNQAGISSLTFGGAPSFLSIVNFENALAILNADQGKMAYVTSPAARTVLKTTAKVLTGATQVVQIAIWTGQDAEGDGLMNDYKAAASNQIANNIMIFANWEDFVQGLYGGFDVVVDPYTQAIIATNRITINTFGDFALRHQASVCVSADSAAQ